MGIIARQPTQHMVDVVSALGGTFSGYKALCRCPAHEDKEPSLSIRQGDRGLFVTCFAGCNTVDILRAIDRIPLTGVAARPIPTRATGTANIDRLWNDSLPVQGTVGERYLASRFLLPVPNDVRFHPRCPLGPKPHTVFKPALLVGVREGQRLVAFQRIFLDRDTATYTEKATLGTLGSGAWRGRGAAATIGIAEGFETARAWSIIHNLPCWSSFGSRRLDLLRLPETVTTLILAGDADLAGRRAVDRAIEAYSAEGRTIQVNYPPGRFNDWASVLEARERGGR